MRLLFSFILAFAISSVLPAQHSAGFHVNEYGAIQKDSLLEAEQLLLAALDNEMESRAFVYHNLGIVQVELDKQEDAKKSFTNALHIDPFYIPALLSRAGIFMEEQEIDKAYIDYCQVLDADKDNKEALLMRAYLNMMNGDFKSSLTDYIRLLQIDPQHYSGRLGLAYLYQKEKKYQDSIRLLDILTVDYPNDPTILIMRASAYKEQNLPVMAISDLDKAIQIDNSIPEAYLLRGESYLLLKKKNHARSDFEKAMSLGIPQSDLIELIKKCR